MKNLILLITALTSSIFVNSQNLLSSLELESFASGFNSPVGIYNSGDERLFIIEQSQADIEIIDLNGNSIGTFLDISSEVQTGGERGLLGLAFHPDYSMNGKFYVNYTRPGGDTVIEEYTVSSDPNIADNSSGDVILVIDQDFSNHNGGHIAFGQDGYLYIGMGDGGSAGDPNGRAQAGNSLLGKMLRIEVTGNGDYSIPADNPFLSNSSVLDEIWSIGLRNPWKFSFDSQTGDMWIGDVGQNQIEEINFEESGGIGGLNYGWKCKEGTQDYDFNSNCSSLNLTDPVAEYQHSFPDGPCSITGGEVYRGTQFSKMTGHYLLTDYCDGKFFSLYPDGNGGFEERLLLQSGTFGFVAFGSDVNGEMYVANANNGLIYKVTDPCDTYSVSISATSSELIASNGDTFTWYKDGVEISNASGISYTPTSSGAYYCISESADGCLAISNQLVVEVGGIYVLGCTNPCSSSFDVTADIDDGSCTVDNICSTNCPGDFNSDQLITAFDLSQFLSAFGNMCE